MARSAKVGRDQGSRSSAGTLCQLHLDTLYELFEEFPHRIGITGLTQHLFEIREKLLQVSLSSMSFSLANLFGSLMQAAFEKEQS